jgi:hypothetical protein
MAFSLQSSVSQEGKYGTAASFMKKNIKDYRQLSYFIAGIDVTDQNLDQLTPYIPGITRMFMHKEPYFMQIAFPLETDNFKSYIETGYKSISGIGDMTVGSEQISGGWANQNYEVISSVTDDTDQISIGIYEQTGSPVREFLELWVTGVRDPRSGVAHYHGVVETPTHLMTGEYPGSYSKAGNENSDVNAENFAARAAEEKPKIFVPYGEKNHTAEFIYYDLDPTAHYIEYACMFAHAFPKSVKKDHLNYSSGDRTPVEMTVDFAVMKYESRYINDLAIHYLIKDQLEYNYLKFDPLFKKYGKNDRNHGISDDDLNYNLDLAANTSTADTSVPT